MKKITFVLIILCSAFIVKGSSNITSPTVSGHWTLSGSPYLIFNSISINYGDSLIIDPGVDIIFQGPYALNPSGSLIATGTASLPINFNVVDTTGWYVDTGYAGGWTGMQSTLGNNATAFSYCNFQHIKNGAISFTNSIHFSHCNFSNNKSAGLLNLNAPDNTVNFEINNCDFYNNSILSSYLIFIYNNLGGITNIHNCNIHDNFLSSTSSLIFGHGVNLLFANNNVYNNGSSSNGGPDGIIQIQCNYQYNSIVFTGNKIYSNVSNRQAPIAISGGIVVDINANYICNNYSLDSGNCGHTFGGGALFMDATPFDTLGYSYVVRNNIIANNYSKYLGGGIYLVAAKATIINNDIINNKAPLGAGMYLDFATSMYIKNNIFYGNTDEGLTDTTSDNINGRGATLNLAYDHNWIMHPFTNDFQFLPGLIINFISDTNTNIIGTNPGLIAPTHTPNDTESALTANFGLLSNSPCINAGSSVGIFPGSIDYAFNNRIFGSSIDIGAYEYGSSPYLETPAIEPIQEKIINIYPNPSTTIFYISTPVASGTIELKDITGRQILEKIVTNTLTLFDVQNLPKGIYFAVWRDGVVKEIEKVVVQ